LREIRERGLTKPRADDTAYYLARFYRSRGFAEAEVEYEIHGNTLQLNIREGPRTLLRNVRFTGNRAVADRILLDYLIGASRERVRQNPGNFPYVLADLLAGVERIRGHYESEGFLDAIIDEPESDISADRAAADITLRIHEGPRYHFGFVRFSGNAPLPANDALTKGLGQDLSQPYTAARLGAMQHNLEHFLQTRGHLKATVSADADPTNAPNQRVPVEFHLAPGPVFSFKGITVHGTERLRASFIPRRFASLQGQTYDPSKLDEKYRELLRTGLFRSLRVESLPQPDNTVQLSVTAEEARAREIGFSIGAGTYEGFAFGVRLADRNLLGSGRPLSLDLEVSQRAIRGELLLVDPWVFESKFAFRGRLYAQQREESGYSKFETGLRGDLSRKFGTHFEASVFAQSELVEITNTVIDAALVGSTAYPIFTLGLSQSLDFRDSPVNPTRGWILSSTIDTDSIGGQPAFNRSTARFSSYHSLSHSLHLALGARAGILVPVTDIPLDERFFLGGASTVRSFAERDLGPKDSHGYPVGGEAFTVFNAELTFPVYRSLQGALFIDAGSLTKSAGTYSLDSLRLGIGGGLRYQLPIGPVRLDAALNPSRKTGEDIGAVHFSFGFAF